MRATDAAVRGSAALRAILGTSVRAAAPARPRRRARSGRPRARHGSTPWAGRRLRVHHAGGDQRLGHAALALTPVVLRPPRHGLDPTRSARFRNGRPRTLGRSTRARVRDAVAPPVMADRRRIVQVLNNLFSNAARHAPEPTPIRVTAVREDAHVAVSVSDEGSAVAPKRLPHLFSKHAGAGPGPTAGHGLSRPLPPGPASNLRQPMTRPAAQPAQPQPVDVEWVLRRTGCRAHPWPAAMTPSTSRCSTRPGGCAARGRNGSCSPRSWKLCPT